MPRQMWMRSPQRGSLHEYRLRRLQKCTSCNAANDRFNELAPPRWHRGQRSSNIPPSFRADLNVCLVVDGFN